MPSHAANLADSALSMGGVLGGANVAASVPKSPKVFQEKNLKSLSSLSNSFTRSNPQLGHKMHKMYKVDAPERGFYKEYRRIKGIRPDFVDFNTKTIYELKPNNPRGIKEGTRQLEKYKKVFEEKFPGESWNTILDLY